MLKGTKSMTLFCLTNLKKKKKPGTARERVRNITKTYTHTFTLYQGNANNYNYYLLRTEYKLVNELLDLIFRGSLMVLELYHIIFSLT